MHQPLVVLSCLLLLTSCAGSAAPLVSDRAVSESKVRGSEAAQRASSATAEDPYLWLEEVTGAQALEWAKTENTRSQRELAEDPSFAPLRKRLLAIYDAKDNIPYASARGGFLYNLWRDEEHPRGLWRRTTLAEYEKREPRWDVLIDLDALGKAEGENWVWGGATCLHPEYTRCLISLSRGGADADVVREFDVTTRAWIEGGFVLAEAKNMIAWKDMNTIYVGTDFGEGSMTASGYPRLVKEWSRGTPLTEARQIFAGGVQDIFVRAYRQHDHGRVRDWLVREVSFFSSEVFLNEGDRQVRIEKPDDAISEIWNDQLLLSLRSAWTLGEHTWPAGALLAIPLPEFLAGKRDFSVLYEPRRNSSLESISATKSAVLVVELEDVKSRLTLHRWTTKGWSRVPVDVPAVGSLRAEGYDAHTSDDYWLTETGFTQPATLSLARVGSNRRKRLKQDPAFFAADGLAVTQHFATSKDGTRVPYFLIAKENAVRDGSTPTILKGYGGFEYSITPDYDETGGPAWLERGGALAIANIRGGGEYGPEWHRAAMKHERQRAYDDFIAIAEDLVASRLTSPPKLGIMGRSNGGLLMGVMLTQRPDLFGAVVCQAPLLDMKRYHKLLAGSSWMEEYGDPEVPEDAAALLRYSPYQNVKRGVQYPRILFTTSTRDDRVHPGHARKMAARMREQGHDVLFYENMEGGHAGAADHDQAAHIAALAHVFFARQLGLAEPTQLSQR
jgi:prolyl oligopeptidase